MDQEGFKVKKRKTSKGKKQAKQVKSAQVAQVAPFWLQVQKVIENADLI